MSNPTRLVSSVDETLEYITPSGAGNWTETGEFFPDYAGVVEATAGLVAYWRLNEVSGSTAEDSAGSLDGSITGAIARVSGITGNWTENPGLMAFGSSTNGIYMVDDHLYLPTKAGAPTDADVPIPRDGAQALDTTNDRLYVRSGETWKYAALT